jgi:hypothetical protein
MSQKRQKVERVVELENKVTRDDGHTKVTLIASSPNWFDHLIKDGKSVVRVSSLDAPSRWMDSNQLASDGMIIDFAHPRQGEVVHNPGNCALYLNNDCAVDLCVLPQEEKMRWHRVLPIINDFGEVFHSAPAIECINGITGKVVGHHKHGFSLPYNIGLNGRVITRNHPKSSNTMSYVDGTLFSTSDCYIRTFILDEIGNAFGESRGGIYYKGRDDTRFVDLVVPLVTSGYRRDRITSNDNGDLFITRLEDKSKCCLYKIESDLFVSRNARVKRSMTELLIHFPNVLCHEIIKYL